MGAVSNRDRWRLQSGMKFPPTRNRHNMEEIFDVVDDQDRVIGRAPRFQVHAQGLRHRALPMVGRLAQPAASSNRILLSRRGCKSNRFPV